MRGLVLLAALLSTSVVLAVGEFAWQPVDSFDSLAAWWTGDPHTDMNQAEVGVRLETARVREGKGALAFMVRVDWTPKPDEKYPKGWPMISRSLDPPQDWSSYDQARLWVYADTQVRLPSPRALGIGFAHGDKGVEDWTFPQNLRPGQWTEVIIPLDRRQRWDDVSGVSFYVAEGWYQDGDRLAFLLDDLRLARRLQPVLGQVSVSPGSGSRGRRVAVEATVAGPWRGLRLELKVTTLAGQPEVRWSSALEGHALSRQYALPELHGTSHQVTVQLQNQTGQTLDTRRQYLRLPPAGKRSYLNLITFYTPELSQLDLQKLTILRESAYQGVAVPMDSGYSTAPLLADELVEKQGLAAKAAAGIDIWPWVFLNRMIGRPPDAKAHPSSQAADLAAFQKIKILDLDDAAGQRTAYLQSFRQAVRLARRLGSPGVVVDLEAYNNYQVYDSGYVAQKRGEALSQVLAACEQLGADMGRICEEEYPACVLWSLFSHLVHAGAAADYPGPVYQTPGHITLGFLKYCRDRKLPALYLCGGEDSPGYYNADVTALQQRIAARYAALAPRLEEFPANYALAGTISPYHDYRVLTSWLQTAAGADPQLKTLEDFGPLLRTLCEQYDWNWVYAASAGQANPYSPDLNRRYSEVLRQAQTTAAGP